MLNQNVANQTNEVAELDLVFISDKEVMTDSLLVAKAFGKRHDHVIRDIEKIIASIADISTAPKFGVSEYKDSTGRSLPKYNLCKDSLMLLVMGYGGKKAMQIKINYINAFNAMYAYIQNTLKSKQEKHFEAVRKFESKKAEMSWHASEMRKWQDDAPLLLAEVERTYKDMQGSIDFAFTDDNKVH